MDTHGIQVLNSIYLSPYIQLATCLRGKARHAGGNMFRHQIETMATLIDYGYNDSVLLKASIIHDVLEDVPDFNINELKHIIKHGSLKAKILKCADRISNMISLGFINNPNFIERYCDETEIYVFPIALEVNYNMYDELLQLVLSRRQYLTDFEFLHHHRKMQLCK